MTTVGELWKSINAGPLGTKWIPNGIRNPLLNWKMNNLIENESEYFQILLNSTVSFTNYDEFKKGTLAAVAEQDKEAFIEFFAKVEKHQAWGDGEDFMGECCPKKNGGRKKKRRRKTKRKSKRKSKRKRKRKTKRKSKRRRKRRR